MEVLILDNETYEESSRFQNFESIVWNERFGRPGDFQIRSYGVKETLSVFPLGTLISVNKSDFVMRVTQHDVDIDQNGNEIVTVSGKTLESIFEERPAVHKISSIETMDAEWPDGWDFGDKYGDVALVSPYSIMMDVINRADRDHYGRSELAKLKLPFSYYMYEDPNPTGEVYNARASNLVYHTIDRGSTIQDVFDELLPMAEMGIATLRPNRNSAIAREHMYLLDDLGDRKLMFVFYHPRAFLEGGPAFEYHMEDYTSETMTASIGNPNYIIQITEDNVILSNLEAEGLGARVDFSEREIVDLNDHDRSQIGWDIGFRVMSQNPVPTAYSLETTGKFPFSDMKYQFANINHNTYFLGDMVKLRTKTAEEAHVRIVEYVRTMDSQGYREYPSFEVIQKIGGLYNTTINQFRNLMEYKNWN